MVAAVDDNVRFSRPAHLPGTELVNAHYRRRAFPTHSHEEFVVGAMTLGAEWLAIGSRRHVAAAGDLILIAPGEAHSNEGVGAEAFGYAVMYMPVPLIAEAIRSLDERPVPLSFRDPVIRDSNLHSGLLRAHALLSRTCNELEQQSVLLEFVGQLFLSDRLLKSKRSAPEHASIRVAREYIDAHFCDSISLSFLSDLTGLSAFHLLRCFQRQVGLSPSRYQTQLRINRCKQLLKEGNGIAEVAATLGFADQSHLTRQFHRIVGITPKRYQSAQTLRA